jgi:hypothetical protein
MWLAPSVLFRAWGLRMPDGRPGGNIFRQELAARAAEGKRAGGDRAIFG